ncbi:MAG TPA: hypothetical protein P5567_03665 [Kiritimatiellia bacterium]|nr:hypothetical protein [Kiritimatiellia bacterium]HRZ11534.1 hypothetical protein [Kiritimatiellia bacterium]HSA16915.1 hypothetical protein [Kiritimatiellia bacterium]
MKLVLLGLGLLLLVALAADLRRMPKRKLPGFTDPADELQAVVLGLNGPRYADPEGLFSIVAPAGWTAFKPPDSRPYDVVFRGPSGSTISVMATPVEYNDLPSLVREIDRNEEEAGIRTQSEAFFFLGGPAVLRKAGLVTSRVFSVDFVRDRVAHHIICSVPPELFDRYYPVLMDVVETYRPGAPKAAAVANE